VKTGPLHYSPEIAREILLYGGAFFVYTAIGNIQPYIDVVILSKLASADAVGWYGAAKNILGTMLAPAMIIGAASYPRLARTAVNGGPFRAEVRAALRPILWLGALAAIGTFLFADDAIAIVYGRRDFGPSAMILKVYAPGFFLLFIDVLLGNALFALGRVTGLTVAKAASLVVSTALELVLIPIFEQRTGNGGIGVVAAFAVSEIVVFGGAVILLGQETLGLNVAIDMARALGSAALTLLLFWWMPPLPFLVGVPICVVAFLLCSVGLGLVRRADVELFRSLLRKEQSAPIA
jgi:O-antigen/teichoic acid export membrane protein